MADIKTAMAVDLLKHLMPVSKDLLKSPLTSEEEEVVRKNALVEAEKAMADLREYHERKNEEWHRSQMKNEEFQTRMVDSYKGMVAGIPGSKETFEFARAELLRRNVASFVIDYKVWDVLQGKNVGLAGPSSHPGPIGCSGTGPVGPSGPDDSGLGGTRGNSSWPGEPGTPGPIGIPHPNTELLRSLSTILNAHQDICDACDREEIKDGPIVEANNRIGTEVMKHLPG
jgi:hypothetical protein